MTPEQFRWLAGVIAAHPQRKVVGRTRLQKTIKLLQRLRFPTEYSYTIHFYGPYSEGVNSDIKLLKQLKLIEEQEQISQENTPYYVLTASADAVLPEMAEFQPAIDLMEQSNPVVLELAATYDAFREMGSDHADALDRLRRKKGSKCQEGREAKAFELLQALGLPVV